MRELGFKALGAAGYVSSTAYFSNSWKIKTRRLKTDLTLSLILRFNLRLGGYSIWSASFIATHIKEGYSGYEHLIATKQSRKYSKDTCKMKFGRTQRCLQKYSEPAVLDYEELGVLSDPDLWDCAHGIDVLE